MGSIPMLLTRQFSHNLKINNMNIQEQKSQLLANLLEIVSIDNLDLEYFLTNAEATNLEELEEYISDNGGFDVDIIYHSVAIEYLMREDQSLSESLELASDLGYAVSDLNSEVLASLIANQRVREDFNNYYTQFTEYFEDLAELEEETNPLD